MGKRGKGSSKKVEKPGDNEKGKLKPTENAKSSKPIVNGWESDRKVKSSKVVIEYNCRLLAEQALSKSLGEKTQQKKISTESVSTTPKLKKELKRISQTTSSSKPEGETASHSRDGLRQKKKPEISEKPQSPVSKPDQEVSRTARRRRKALTRALKRIRKTHRPVKNTQKTRVSLRLSSPTKRSLRSRDSSSSSPEKVNPSSSRRHPPKLSPKMDRHVEERESSPNAASNSGLLSSPESESEDYTDLHVNLDGDESDSDDDLQMQVLEKQVESEKEDEEDDGPPDVSLNLPDDTDEESSLLSPSALPASQLFRSPSSRRKKRKSLSDLTISDNPKQDDVSTTPIRVRTSTPTNPSYIPRPSTSVSSAQLFNTASTTLSSHSNLGILAPGSLGPLPEKRGRGRPRKFPIDSKTVTSNSYRKKLAERMAVAPKTEERGDQYDFELHHHQQQQQQQQQMLQYPSSSMSYDDFDPAAHPIMDEFYADETGHNDGNYQPPPENIHQRLQRWKDRSTFVYARHKFVSNENKFRCDVCQVSFTALSSLKRHYGTIYHKQQEAAGGSTLDLSDILRPDREDNLDLDLSSEPSSCHSSGRGRGRGRPPLARTTSFVRRNAVDSIKKYYAAADAARRRRENYTASTATTTSRAGGGFSSTWIQKQQRKRKPLLHSDYLYQSASTDSDEVEEVDDDDDDFGCEDDENNENDSPENGNGDNGAAADVGEEVVEQTPWLSNVWKGIGPPHFTCEVCGEKYTKKFEFTKHLFEHRQEEAHRLSLTCPDCQIVFQNENLLEQHFNLFNHGIGVIREGRGVAKEVKKLTCPKCNSKFMRRDYYKKHLEVHKRPLLRCPHCPKKFSYKFYLSDHIKAKHDGWANNLANSSNSNNNGLACGSLAAGVSATVGNSAPSNPIITSQSVVPKPKVELYSSTTPLLLSTETNKRKNSTITTGSAENFPYDDAASNDITTSKKKSATPSGNRAPTAPEIPVPKFITCDAFPEDRDITIGGKVDYNFESNANKTGFEINETSVTPIQPTLDSSLDHPKKEMATLLQKFFDSQQQEQRDKDRDSVNSTRDISEIKNASSSSASNSLSGIGHSTTEDGKIVFQLEHSMFKGFAAMKCGEGDENACNMSPLTIEIPRDNINIDADGDGGNEMEESETSNEDSNKLEAAATVDTDRQDDSSTSQKIPQTGTEETDKSALQHCTSSNSSTLTISSAPQFLGCGATTNPGVQIQPTNELQCQDCGKVFELKKSLIKHVQYYNQCESYPCLLCGKTFKLKHHVSRHIKSFHNVDTSSTTSSASDDTHLEDHGEIDYLSTLSATGMGSTASWSSSSLLATPSSSATVTSAASVTFSPAKRSLSTDKSTSATHQKERVRSASDAGRKKEDGEVASPSFSKSNYTTVVDSSGATVFKCLICKKLYPSKHQISSHLSYHKRTISAYKCTVCSAEFKCKQDLTAHQEMHNSDKVKIICEKCPPGSSKIFLSKKDVLKHMREKHHHLGRKPLPYESHNVEGELTISRCPYCPLVFPQASDMQAHISLEHHDKETFVCRKCGQVLGCAELLKEHMLQDHQLDEYDFDEDDDLPKVVRNEMEEDDDQPPTPSPHTSPIHMVAQPSKADDYDKQDEPQEEDAEPSSPELELLEVN